MHVRERLASNPMLAIDDVLTRLGTPQSLAKEYQNTQILTRASRSYSPLLMLRATLRWALTGVQGFLVFNIAILGYLLGVSFVLLALAKPFFPDKIGLWIGPHLFESGFRPENARLSPAHELLGFWYIPAAAALGVFFTAGTTRLLRVIISHFGQLRLRLSSPGRHAAMA